MFGPSSSPNYWDTLCVPPGAAHRCVPVGNSERSSMSTNTAVVSIVAIVCLSLLMAYIVHATGGTTGLTDLGDAVASIVRAIGEIIAAVTGHHHR